MIAQKRYLKKRQIKKIKDAIKDKGLTYRDLAELLGKSIWAIKNVVNGYTYSYAVAKGIERALGTEGLFPYLKEMEEKRKKRELAIETAKKNLSKGVK
jgi:transcriptional regulator with XRE-family HTH domain